MSAIGSLIAVSYSKLVIEFSIVDYQLDLTTPGSLPWEARLRKQIRQIPNFLMNARGLPHMGHRLYALTLNFGFLFTFSLSDVFANAFSL
jgi:hypothetical protein